MVYEVVLNVCMCVHVCACVCVCVARVQSRTVYIMYSRIYVDM
jgi:hypothetical protein